MCKQGQETAESRMCNMSDVWFWQGEGEMLHTHTKYKVRPQTHCDAVLSESSIRHAMVQFCLSCSRLNFSYTTTRHISIKFLSRAQSSGFLGFLPVLKSHPKFWSHGTIVNICTCSPFALQWSRGHFVCFRNAILLEFGWWIVHFVRHSYWFTSS